MVAVARTVARVYALHSGHSGAPQGSAGALRSRSASVYDPLSDFAGVRGLHSLTSRLLASPHYYEPGRSGHTGDDQMTRHITTAPQAASRGPFVSLQVPNRPTTIPAGPTLTHYTLTSPLTQFAPTVRAEQPLTNYLQAGFLA